MRLFRVLPILSLLFGARASSLDSRQPAAHPLDARYLLDVCALVKTELIIPNPITNGPLVIGAIGQFNVPLSQPISSVLHNDFDR
jgi:hypothetical protein